MVSWENAADSPYSLVLSLVESWKVPQELRHQVSQPVAFRDFLVLPKARWLLGPPVPRGLCPSPGGECPWGLVGGNYRAPQAGLAPQLSSPGCRSPKCQRQSLSPPSISRERPQAAVCAPNWSETPLLASLLRFKSTVVVGSEAQTARRVQTHPSPLTLTRNLLYWPFPRGLSPDCLKQPVTAKNPAQAKAPQVPAGTGSNHISPQGWISLLVQPSLKHFPESSLWYSFHAISLRMSC